MSRAAFILAVACARPPLAQTVDYDLRQAVIPQRQGQTILPKYQTLFTPSARWNGPIRWKYNHTYAPTFADEADNVVAQLQRSFDKWSSRCAVAQIYDGETTSAPGALVVDSEGGLVPDGVSVVGWGILDPSLAGWTYAWYADNGGEREIFDIDVTLSVNGINSWSKLGRLMTHEWGHALGLDHSDVEAAIMAGPPLTQYNVLVDPQPDDLRGCRCLYGLPPGLSAPYACSLPVAIDVGAAVIGEATAAPPVTLTNSGNAPLAIESANVEGAQFRQAAGCVAGTVVMPGASCTLDIEAVPIAAGAIKGKLTLYTTDGKYEFALAANGVTESTAVPPTPTDEVVEFYNATLDHYFITRTVAEIAKLDAGLTVTRWSRTGLAFRAYALTQPGTSAICRFYLPPIDGDSHFFGRGADECLATALAHPDFVLEESEYMHMSLPADGTCVAKTNPVYRLFDNRVDANHRYTTNRAVRDQMIANGWVAEGDGPDLVVMCAPA